MFRDAVAEHYRSKGYRLHQDVKVRGSSGDIHACDMIAQGPLGSLVISFGDDSGFEGPEMGAVRRAARDIGGTPVVAVEDMPEGIRRLAARAGVVLVDRQTLERPELVEEPAATPAEPDYPPWPSPDQERTESNGTQRATRRPVGPPRDIDEVVEESLAPRPEPTRRVDPGIWKHPRHGQADAQVVPAPQGQPFDWLPKKEIAAKEEPQRPAGVLQVHVPARSAKATMLPLKLVLFALLAGGTAGLVFFGLQAL